MIVRCERCETRFKLDEARLPARGARVRCSRCKHAFFVIPPGSSREDLVHDVAASTAAAANPTTRSPGPTWDLEDGSGTPATAAPIGRSAAAASNAAAGAEPDDDNDWRFEDDLPGIDAGETAASLDLTGSSPAFLPSPDANEDSFADLGDPETWDLLSNDSPAPMPVPESPVPDVAPPVVLPEVPSAAVPVVREIETPVPTRAPVASPIASATTTPVVAARSATAPAASRSAVARAAGWTTAVALSAFVAWASLSPPTTTPVSLAPVAGFDVTEARARILENAAAGPVLVVSGRLRNPASTPRALGAPLRVQLLDAAGVPLEGASAFAGPILSTQRIREAPPEQLRAAQQADAVAFARRSVEAGGELRFDAIFGPAPRAAASVVFDAAGTTPSSGR